MSSVTSPPTPPRRPRARHAFAWLGLLLLAAGAQAADVRDNLRQKMTQLATGAALVADGGPVTAKEVLPALYEQRGYAPVWSSAAPIEELIAALQIADQNGLDPKDYRLDTAEQALRALRAGQPGTVEEQADRDIALSDSLVRLVEHLHYGRIDPVRVYADWSVRPQTPDPVAEVGGALQRGEVKALVERAIPTYPPYQRLVKALGQYRELAARGGWPTVADGPTLKPGEESPRIRQVRARLKVTGELAAGAPTSDVYDPGLVEAVKAFQARHGLGSDGEIGRKTVVAMNVSAAQRVDQLRVNLERARWALHALRDTYVVVDIAGYTAVFVRDGKVVWESRAQVGQPLRKTPVLQSRFTDLVFNPTWTVPPTVLDQDIIPAAKHDPEVVVKKGLRVLDRDRNELDPYEIDWSRYSGKNFPYVLRQDSGAGNSLGKVKFNFPNRHAVYMHDTPKKAYFGRAERAFSSGCIRIDKPLELAELLLDDPKNWSREQIEAAIAKGGTRTVMLRKQVPVLILYWTVDVDDHGRVTFKNDVYDQDRLVLNEMRKPAVFRGSIRTARGSRPPADEMPKEPTITEAHGA
ncbi:MAG: L,D-transpeptidase family protein [Gammaproteobacteria bacterium]|nr:L,D-transpeptidase family protein [Gammaproteobacteria bacterium]